MALAKLGSISRSCIINSSVFTIVPLVQLDFESNLTNSGSATISVTQTVSASQSYTTGKIGSKALTFSQSNNTTSTGNNGSRSYISFVLGNLKVPYTVCMWLYLNTATTGNNSWMEIVTPLSSGGISIFTIYNTAVFAVTTNATSCAFTGSPYFATGSWVHLAMVFSSTSNVTTYYNGVKANTNTNFASTIQTTTAGNHTFNIGWAPYQATAYGNPAFNGAVDQFLVYGSALTDAQITSIYNGTLRF